jgi:hypothetical protein
VKIIDFDNPKSYEERQMTFFVNNWDNNYKKAGSKDAFRK